MKKILEMKSIIIKGIIKILMMEIKLIKLNLGKKRVLSILRENKILKEDTKIIIQNNNKINF